MVGLLDLAVTLGGIIIPPAFDFIKKKFVKSENDTPERTIGALATTKPEAVAGYVLALSDLKRADVEYFNRDVIGIPSQLVVNLRAAIRPVGVCVALGILGTMVVLAMMGNLAEVVSTAGEETIIGVRLSCEGMVSSWFGNRISITK